MRTLGLVVLAGLFGSLLACEADKEPGDTAGAGAFDHIEGVSVDVAAMLEAHNAVRRPLGLAEFTYDDGLAADSELWSKTLADDACGFYHSAAEGYGENLYWISATATEQRVVDAWASEVADYDYASNSCAAGKQCGHYTQIVWDSTERVGCGAARCPDDGGEVWTCRYDPPGNWVGEWPY